MTNKSKLILIKIIHTAVWIFFNVVIFYMLYAVTANKIDFLLWICYTLIAIEGIVLLIFKLFCPLTIWARKYSASTKENFDILIARDGQKPKPIQEISYKTFFEDCPFVVNKFENKRYKFTPTSGIKKLLKSDGLSGAKLESAANLVVDDYMTKCAK